MNIYTDLFISLLSFDLRSSLLTLGIADASIALLSLNRGLQISKLLESSYFSLPLVILILHSSFFTLHFSVLP